MRTQFACLALMALATAEATSVAQAQATYVLEASSSRVTFRGRAFLQSIAGQTDALSGRVSLVAKDLESLRGTIRFPVTSLRVEPAVSRSEIMQLFGGAPDAEIVFLVDSLEPRGAKEVALHGRLSMNGVTQPVTFAGTAQLTADGLLLADGRTRVDMREWRIRPPSRLRGLVHMHHDITLAFRALFRPRISPPATAIATGSARSSSR